MLLNYVWSLVLMYNCQNAPSGIGEASFLQLVLLAMMTVFQVASFIKMSRDMLLVTSLGFAVLEKLYSFTFFYVFQIESDSNNWQVSLISLALSYSYQRKMPQLARPPSSPLPPN